MITHGNLLHNSSLIHGAFGSVAEARGVFWLPMFHDMGLIGGVIQTLYCGGSSTLLSPVSFIQRPIRWLEAISRTGATISGAPNFAYELCIEKATPEQRAGLDLSSWRVAFNGAEPVRAETLDRFTEVFEPAGFRRESFLPCYGLAEATLLVSAGPRGNPTIILPVDGDALERGEVAEARPTASVKRLVASGRVVDGQRVVIVDPATGNPCPDGRVGEIWVAGPSVALGYWGRPADTKAIFDARLGGGEGPFLRTGDLGSLKDDALFVTGRLNDMIILGGRNIYPQDIEWTTERCHPALVAGGAAAFAIEVNGDERLAIIQEVERTPDPTTINEIITAIRREVAEQHDIEVHAIRLIKRLSLPRTSSGKVRRHACRESFLAGTLEIVAQWAQMSAMAASSPCQSVGPLDRTEAATVSPSRDRIAAWLAAKVASPLGIRPQEVEYPDRLPSSCPPRPAGTCGTHPARADRVPRARPRPGRAAGRAPRADRRRPVRASVAGRGLGHASRRPVPFDCNRWWDARVGWSTATA